ncbi:hypothetical protein ACP6IB_26875 [Vibrio harveyi]|uniref:hypothetical protein n=1 Tax=Vibrio harveyi TaxID=669 RepID=UPI003CFAD20F
MKCGGRVLHTLIGRYVAIYPKLALFRDLDLNNLQPIYDLQFEQMSGNSSYWHSKSCHLRESAEILWDAWSRGETLDSGDTYRMIMGMSFELLFKSFLVANSIEIEHTHNLNDLAERAGFTLDDKESCILHNLTGYIYWEGKYPVPKPIATRKLNVSGGEGIKSQREPFLSIYASDQNIIEDQSAVTSLLTSNDLDYDNLLLLWQKFNNEYVSKHIAT